MNNGWIAEMRRQAEYDRDNGRLNTLVDSHCLLDVLDALGQAEASLAGLQEQIKGLEAKLRSSLYTTFNDYKDESTVRGKFAKACPYLSAHSIERMVEVFCDALAALHPKEHPHEL